MSMNKQEILCEWETIHGELTPEWRGKFLADPLVERLCQIDPDAVRKGIRSSHKLEAILEAARAHRSRHVKSSARRRTKLRARRVNRSRYSGGHYPHQSADRDLHKRIGRTQEYSDDV